MRFIVNLAVDAQLTEQLALNIPAAGAVGISHGVRLQQRLPQGRHRTDIRHRRARFDDHPDGRIRQLHAGAWRGPAILFQFRQRIAHHNHHVRFFAPGEPGRNGLRRFAH